MNTNRKTIWGRALHTACLLAASAAVCFTLDSCSGGGGGHGGKSNPDISVLDGYTLTVEAQRGDQGPNGVVSFKILGDEAVNLRIVSPLPESDDLEMQAAFPEIPVKAELTPLSKPVFSNRRLVLECEAYWYDGMEDHFEHITIDFTFSNMVDFRDLGPEFPDNPVGSPTVSRLPDDFVGAPMKYDIPSIHGHVD
ncbi:MAG: hypothetical protein MJ058_00860 [Akkermansia sp.]|nr:hypothetical protein [Akkermansia sp.]